jgi:probable rRNA maturation factor
MAYARPGVQAAAREALRQEDAPDGELTVVLADGKRARDLNRRFAGEDHATDVLSFPDWTNGDEGLRYFGDVVIAVPVAQAQADAAGHSLSDEMALLAVHGVLHLLGHDHAGGAERERMEAAQRKILTALEAQRRRRGPSP